MHIPDGYLSPTTCAALYAASAPFGWVALGRVQRMLATRAIPLLALFSAFCFVVMMFNLPLPGGTTGHAVGMGIAAIVLGPWAAMIAVATALLIQALFFGDGGITAYGANCFNMAVVGCLTASAVYRLCAGSAPLTSPRRVLAASFAGYAAINAAALFAAVEFGLQPLFFHDAAGAPLYAPYPLAIAVPAMMVGHLTIAGLAEAFMAGGVVAYLQRADPTLLRATAPADVDESAVATNGWRATAPLWIGLALLMIATPLGLLAVGTAWGEWSVKELSDPHAHPGIAAGPGDVAPPEGLARLADFWTAPFPDYAPEFLKSRPLGYLLSAMMGAGLIILIGLGVGWLAGRFRRSAP